MEKFNRKRRSFDERRDAYASVALRTRRAIAMSISSPFAFQYNSRPPGDQAGGPIGYVIWNAMCERTLLDQEAKEAAA